MVAESRDRHFVPHAVIALAFLAGIMGAQENLCIAIIIASHLAVPIWSAVLATRSGDLRRGLRRGPGSVIAVHAFLIGIAMIFVLLGGSEAWLAWMVLVQWIVALLVYMAYAMVAFFVTVKIVRIRR